MSAMDKIKSARSVEALAEQLPELLLTLAAETARLSAQLALTRDEVSAVREELTETRGALSAARDEVSVLSEEARRSGEELAENRERLSQDWTEALTEAAAVWESAAAERLEPVAQSMVVLSDETRQAIAAQRASGEAQARVWSEARSKTVAEWNEAARELSQAAQVARGAVWGWGWAPWFGVTLAALAPILALVIGFELWLPQGWTLQEGAGGARWLQVVDWSAVPAAAPATAPGTP